MSERLELDAVMEALTIIGLVEGQRITVEGWGPIRITNVIVGNDFPFVIAVMGTSTGTGNTVVIPWVTMPGYTTGV